jgi:lysophospholipase L1-like esterase
MHRRTFTAAGVPTDELLPYVRAMKNVAADTKTPLVDLYASSGDLFTRLGEAGSEDLTAPNDRTHFTEAGAMKIAALVVAGLKRNPDPRLQAAILGDGTGKAAPGTLENP